ncbi:lysosomal Pro-X carboxypeptidase [Rhynchophorus ferrugineus]|uniref:lysosomal Pro-X carboxypeptidase n=1 Tax=Rhynchophorus ferrugineus TaxID=354439 RepID=UPI003FCE46F7
MKYIVAFLLFTFAYCDDYLFTTKYIDIPLDHFSFTNNKTFKLRYLVNDSYYVVNHPIFFYTGNEGDISMFAQNTGFMFDLAEKFNSLIIFAEHRFYGETLPFGNESYSSPENLGYLSAQQALADFVYLIDYLQKQYLNSTELEKLPVIAFGGSYGGMLSAWLRMKYPYSVIGAIASSAPIWQFKGLTNCENFNKINTDVLKSLGSENCVNTIKKSWAILRSKTNSTDGKNNVSQQFSLCKDLQNSDDVETLLNWLSEIYTNVVMVNYPYPTDFLNPLPANPAREFCNRVDNINYKDDTGLIQALAAGVGLYTNYTGIVKCNDILQTATSSLGETGWNFQSCTDMIMPMCSTDDDMFENSKWNFQEFSDDCFKQFKVRPLNEEVPILEFGGKDIGTASNIVFSNGLLDPWSSGGVLRNISDTAVAVIIPDAAHHFDLRSENPSDPETVKFARKFHETHIKRWLHKFYLNGNHIYKFKQYE